MKRTASWLVLAVIVGVALAIGGQGDGRPPTDEERAMRIADTIRCPTCRSQSMADSDAPAAQAGLEEIRRQVREGRTASEIRNFFTARYGQDIVLDPPRRGVGAVVWVLPLLAVVVAAGGLAMAFRRWKPKRRRASSADRALVDAALGRSQDRGP